MFTSHRVTQFNCGQPLRDHTPSELIHPYLHEVNIDASLIRGMIKSTSGVNLPGTIKEGQEFLRLIESSDNSPATQRVACVPDAATFQPVRDTLAEIGNLCAAVYADGNYIPVDGASEVGNG